MQEESAKYRIKELYKSLIDVRKKYGYHAELNNGAIAESIFAHKENEAAEKQKEGREQDRPGARARGGHATLR